MSQTVSPSTSRCYSLARVSRAWNVPRAGVYRFLKGTPSPAIARRPGPRGPCPDADLADLIRREIEASDFHGEGYRKIWARLRVAGVRSSPRRVRRVMGENGLLAPHRVGRNQEKTHDGTIVTDKVNEMWGTDMSQTVTLEQGRAYVFVAVEHANSEIIGIHAARSANRFEALEPVRQGVHRCFGSIAPGVARGLKLRHDHGSNYMSGDFQDEIKCLGIEASPSFVREPEGNGVAERFIRTLKENLLWVRTFKTIEELRAELVAFARRYNETWLVARHGYKTPARVREEQTTPRIAIDPTLAAALPLAAYKSLWAGIDEDNWVGWLHIVEREMADLDRLRGVAEQVNQGGFTDVILLGMGGSSLGPEVLGKTFGQQAGWPRFHMLDSTDPAQIRTIERAVDLGKTLVHRFRGSNHIRQPGRACRTKYGRRGRR